jgi:pimeloyl-ACP methyl ester carboxylesterase
VDTPQWFVDALTRTPEECETTVDGATIHYRRWGEPERAGLVLVHGGAAHARWWDHVAPLLADEYCVAGLILIDSMVQRPDPEEEAARVGGAFGPLRTYASVAEALPRFRTVPDQPTSLPYVIDHVARMSLRAVPGGFQWKFDPRIFERRSVPHGTLLEQVKCRVALFRAEHGLVSVDIGAYMYEQLGRLAPVVEVPLAWHHIMLDQPIALITGLRALLADWEHSTPQARAKPGIVSGAS